jgi:hypothetical protein
MMKVKVLIPFTDKVTGKDHNADDIIEVSEERLAEIKSVNVNMVLVLGEAEEKPKTTTPKAKAMK